MLINCSSRRREPFHDAQPVKRQNQLKVRFSCGVTRTNRLAESDDSLEEDCAPANFREPNNSDAEEDLNSAACALHDWQDLHKKDDASKGDLEFVEEDDLAHDNEDFNPDADKESQSSEGKRSIFHIPF